MERWWDELTFDEEHGGEEPDEAVDVHGDQRPVDWSREPFSDFDLLRGLLAHLAPPGDRD